MDSRPPPPRGAPPTYAFVSRMYSRNLRPVVMSFAFLAGLWTLFSGIGFFRNASAWSQNNETQLQLVSIILGALNMVVFVIEAFGVFAASTQRVRLVRTFAYLSGLVVLIIAASGFVKVVIHFSLKNDIISTCSHVTEGQTVFFGGFFGPVSAGTITQEGAQDWCNRQWDRSSWSDILGLLITTVLAAFFAAVAFSFLRQLLDPTSAANVTREPAVRMGTQYPLAYNPPYGAPGYYPNYPAPAGPPPQSDAFVAPPYDAENKPPGYVRGDDFKNPFEDPKKTGYGWGAEGANDEGPSERDVTSRAGRNPFI